MGAPNLDAIRISNLLSLSAVKIFPARKQTSGELLKGGHGTGFFWESERDLYLITNWHNVCAWDPVTDKALSEKGFTPNCIELVLELAVDVGDGRIKRDARTAVVDLFDIDGTPTWFEHEKFGRKVDVIALKIATLDDVKLLNPALNTYSSFVDYEIAAGDDAYILGYPLGLDGGPRLPIWKRASIATEPHYDLDGLPKMLVDTATRKGMSGGPAIAVRRGIIKPRGATDFGQNIIGTAERFLGVYSGRIGNDEFGAQLGIVWKSSVVDEIVHRKIRGKSPFEL